MWLINKLFNRFSKNKSICKSAINANPGNSVDAFCELATILRVPKYTKSDFVESDYSKHGICGLNLGPIYSTNNSITYKYFIFGSKEYSDMVLKYKPIPLELYERNKKIIEFANLQSHDIWIGSAKF